MAEKNLIITSHGLTKVSKKLITKRTYNSSAITYIGTPFVSKEGVANTFSKTDYLQHPGLFFNDEDEISIRTLGTFSTPIERTGYGCLWSLKGVSSNLTLAMYAGLIELRLNETVIARVTELDFVAGENINIVTKVTSTSYEFDIIKDNAYRVFSGSFENRLVLSVYDRIRLGNENTSDNNYWTGSINVAEFIISKNGSLYYSPSFAPTFDFTKMMVSDSTHHLTDTSVPVANHVYEFQVNEIKRTGNNVVVVATIGSDITLNIAEMGLYSTGPDGTVLFSLVDGLAIKKTKDLGYGLIFNINLSTNVVNTIAMPEIVLAEQEHTNWSTFDKIRKAHLYQLINLERIVDNNAIELGRNRSQNVYVQETKLELIQENFKAVKAYSGIKKRIHPTVTPVFDSSKVTAVGNVVITNEGMISGFTTSNYATLPVSTSNTPSNWEVKASFICNHTSIAEETIFNLNSNSNAEDILTIGITNSNNCFVKLKTKASIDAFNSFLSSNIAYERDSNADFTQGNVNYYAWKDSTNSSWSNPHLTSVGGIMNTGLVYTNFSTADYIKTPNALNPTSSYDLKFSFKTGSIGTAQTLCEGETNYNLRVALNTSGKLVYSIGDGTAWVVEAGAGSHTLAANTNYTLRLFYTGASYLATLISGSMEEADWNYSSSFKTFNSKVVFGRSSSDYWTGDIDLTSAYMKEGTVNLWTSSYTDNKAYTTTLSPTTSTPLYDGQLCTLSYTTITGISTGNLINENIFRVHLDEKYFIRVVRSNDSYKISYSLDDKEYTEVVSVTSSRNIQQVGSFLIGIKYNSALSAYTNPLLGFVDMFNSKIVFDDVDFTPIKYIYYYGELRDFYAVPEYKAMKYKLRNLSDLENSDITYYDGDLLGANDSIDFNNDKGFSLCIKTDFTDGANKVLLNKINKTSGDYYFHYYLLNNELVFEFYTENNVVRLSKQYSDNTINQITAFPFLLTITYNGDVINNEFKMYRNNTLLDTATQINLGDFLSTKNTSLMNHEYEQISETNYIYNIASFQGCLTSEEIFFLTNEFDCNY